MRPTHLLLGGALVAGAVVAWTLFSDEGWPKASRLQKEQAQLEARAETLRNENAELLKEAQRLGDEGSDAALEQVVREELGHVRPDEVVVLTGVEAEAEGASPER